PTMVRLLQVVLVLLTTLRAAGILATLALFGRHEGEHPLALGLRRYALPLAGVLLLLYAMLAVYTAHVENSWKREITLRIQHEGRFLAQQAGKQWHQ
ncbi:MAG: hypothetical protein NZ749_06860, partial [bacterium]|nr:hypothetical protein [bacterium]